MSNEILNYVDELEKLSNDLSMILRGMEMQGYALLPRIDDFMKQCQSVVSRKDVEDKTIERVEYLLENWNLILSSFDNKPKNIKFGKNESVFLIRVGNIGILHSQFANDIQAFVSPMKLGSGASIFRQTSRVYDDDDVAKSKK